MKFERKYYGRFEHRSDCLVATQSDIERSLDTSFDWPKTYIKPGTESRTSIDQHGTTSSPGSSRFSKWRRLGRRPWHTADHVSPTRMYSKWRLRRGEKGEKNWVRDVAKVKINKMAEKAEVQFKKK